MKAINNFPAYPNAQIRKLEPVLKSSPQKEGLLIPTLDGFDIIKTSEILRCQSDGAYCRIFTKDGASLIASKTLKMIENAINHPHFIRIHQSHLIHIDSIKKMTVSEIILKEGTVLPFSRRRKDLILKCLKIRYTQV